LIIFKIKNRLLKSLFFYFLKKKKDAESINAKTAIITISGQVLGSLSLFSEIASTFLPVSFFVQLVPDNCLFSFVVVSLLSVDSCLVSVVSFLSSVFVVVLSSLGHAAFIFVLVSSF
jgi:hypothetical protein